jgi:hypothetical protein
LSQKEAVLVFQMLDHVHISFFLQEQRLQEASLGSNEDCAKLLLQGTVAFSPECLRDYSRTSDSDEKMMIGRR